MGVVAAVGESVTLVKPGDEVWYAGSLSRPGSNSEYQLVDERIAALALLPDEHHIDTHRLTRQIGVCRAMATTSPAMRPVRDNPLYRAEERERIADGERQWNREWSSHE